MGEKKAGKRKIPKLLNEGRSTLNISKDLHIDHRKIKRLSGNIPKLRNRRKRKALCICRPRGDRKLNQVTGIQLHLTRAQIFQLESKTKKQKNE